MNKNYQNIVNLSKKDIHPVEHKKSLFGFLTFIFIFVIIIPFFLIKFKYYLFLQGYMPNIDLIANLLSWHGGYGIWDHLYPPLPTTLSGFYNQTIINYISLLGVSFVISKETKKTNSIITGWSLAFVMLLMTYLLPSRLLSWIMDKIDIMLKNKSFQYSHITSFVIGIILTISIIVGEMYVLSVLKNPLHKLAKFIINLPKII
jgi:hypothetical protein